MLVKLAVWLMKLSGKAYYLAYYNPPYIYKVYPSGNYHESIHLIVAILRSHLIEFEGGDSVKDMDETWRNLKEYFSSERPVR